MRVSAYGRMGRWWGLWTSEAVDTVDLLDGVDVVRFSVH